MSATRLSPDDDDLGLLLAAQAGAQWNAVLAAIERAAVGFAGGVFMIEADLFAEALGHAAGMVRKRVEQIDNTVIGRLAADKLVTAFLSKANEERGRLLATAVAP